MSGPRIGELFAGYGGLGMGVKAVLGGEVAWVSEIDKGACKVLAHRFPDVPNHGDISTVQWVPTCGAYEFEGCGQPAEVLPDRSGWQCHRCQKLWPISLGKVYWPEVPEPVDVLTGGFPCQDVSSAGKRAGIRPGTRSGLWAQFAYAIDQLRPSLVVIENVRGLLSAEAHSDVEPCPWCVGDDPDGALRALGAVLGDLADLGFDAEWVGVPASRVGACHERWREFIAAYPADTHDPRPWATGLDRGWAGTKHGVGARQLLALLPTPRATDGTKGGPNQRGSSGDLMLPSVVTLLPTPMAQEPGGTHKQYRARWGDYAAAIHRWEQTLGRPAPAPTQTSSKGNPQLAPTFVEWMMGLPAGWVTDVPGITRSEALRLCGNGVVPQQAEAALRVLLSRQGVAA